MHSAAVTLLTAGLQRAVYTRVMPRRTALMRILRLFLVSFSLLFLSGCWIYTLNPLYQDQDVYAFDASLTGSWINPVGDCLLTLSPDNNLYPSYYRVLYSAPDPQKGECLVAPGQNA